jgi:hypothetical protein
MAPTYIADKSTLISVFGEQVTVEPTPQIQISNQYGLDPTLRDDLETFSATGGSVDSNSNKFRCQSGTSVGGYGVIRSKETAIYRPGQGHECRITGKFTTGVALSLQFAGMFSLTETAAFGYDGADFSIIHEYNGEAEVQSFQVTAAAGGAESATVTIDGNAYTANLTAGTVQDNAFEIARDGRADPTVGGAWRIEQVEDTVYFIARSVGDKTGTFSFSSATATATVTEETAGVAKTSGNVAQASWNITTTPFTGFDPTKLNLYRIEYGYLGAVSLVYSIYNAETGFFVPVHRIKWANNNDFPIFGNPDMKVGWTAASLGSSGTNLTVEGASAYIGVDGKEVIRNQSLADENIVLSVPNTFTNLITLRNRIVYGNRFNLGKLQPIGITIDNDHNKGLIVDVLINPTVGGVTNFQYEDEVNSLALADKQGTTVTGGILKDAFTVPAGGDITVNLKDLAIDVLPEDELVVSARTVSGIATSVTVAIVWLEEK